MDLAPGKSFVEWAVTHGHTVFAISYRQPGHSSSATSASTTTCANGPLAALDVVQSITGATKVNVGGALPRRHARGLRGRLARAAGGDDRLRRADDAEHAARLRRAGRARACSPTPTASRRSTR